MYDTLLPLFNGAHSNVKPYDTQVEAKNQPLHVHDKSFDDIHVDDVVDEERREVLESKGMKKWLVQTLVDNNFVAHLHTHTSFWI